MLVQVAPVDAQSFRPASAHSLTSSQVSPSPLSEYPAPHEQAKEPGLLVHVCSQPPLAVEHSLTSTSQLVPVHPESQEQEKELTPSVHEPCRQGFDAQSSMFVSQVVPV